MSSSKPLPAWADLAEQRGVHWCRGLQPNGQKCGEDHVKGVVTAKPTLNLHYSSDMVIHWADQTATRPRVKRFLWLIAEAEHRDEPADWYRFYLTIRTAIRYSQQAGLRLPTSYWAHEKVKLKSMLLDVPTTLANREEAMDWATRPAPNRGASAC